MSAQTAAWRSQLYEGIGKRVQNRRSAKDLPLREVATKIGMSYQAVQRIESGEGAPMHFLVAFAQLVGCTVNDLIPDVPFTFINHVFEKEKIR